MLLLIKLGICVMMLEGAFISATQKEFDFVQVEYNHLAGHNKLIRLDPKEWLTLRSCLVDFSLYYKELKTAPDESWVGIFEHIPVPVIAEYKWNIQKQIRHFQDLHELYPADRAIEKTVEELRELYLVWDGLYDAKACFYMANRRKGLQTILNYMGEEAFMNGEMPYPYPRHRFMAIR